MVDRRESGDFATLQSTNCKETSLTKYTISEEVGSDVVESEEVEVESDEVESEEVESEKVESEEVESDEVESEEVESDEVESEEVESDEVESEEVESDEVDSDEVESDEVDSDEFESEEIQDLVAALQSPNCKLTSLDLSDNNIRSGGARALAVALQSPNCKLTSLNLSDNTIRSGGALALVDALQSPNCKLTSLNLSSNGIEEVDLALAIAVALQSVNCKLTSLDLSRYHILESECVEALAVALQNPNCKLISLNLSNSYIFDSGGIQALAVALQNPNCKLTSLNLSRNYISKSGGAQALAVALQSPNCKLTALDLSGNEISSEGALALVVALRSPNCKLTSFNLGGNIGLEGVQALAVALQSPNCKLTSLEIQVWLSEIESGGVQAVAVALQSPNCKLTSLNLGGNIGLEGVQALAVALQSPNCKLTSLHNRAISLKWCKIELEGVQALAVALQNPHCKLLHLSIDFVGNSPESRILKDLLRENNNLEQIPFLGPLLLRSGIDRSCRQGYVALLTREKLDSPEVWEAGITYSRLKLAGIPVRDIFHLLGTFELLYRTSPMISSNQGLSLVPTTGTSCEVLSFVCPVFSPDFQQASDEINLLLTKQLPFSSMATSLWNEISDIRVKRREFRNQFDQRRQRVSSAPNSQISKLWQQIEDAEKALGTTPLLLMTDEHKKNIKIRDDVYVELNGLAKATETVLIDFKEELSALENSVEEANVALSGLIEEKSQCAVGTRHWGSPTLPSHLLNGMIERFKRAYKRISDVSLNSTREAVDDACNDALDHANALLHVKTEIVVSDVFVTDLEKYIRRVQKKLGGYYKRYRASMMSEEDIQKVRLHHSMKERAEHIIVQAVLILDQREGYEIECLETEVRQRQLLRERNVKGAKSAKEQAEHAKSKATECKNQVAQLDHELRTLLTKNTALEADSERDSEVECYFPELYGQITRLLDPELSAMSSTSILKADLLVKGLLLVDHFDTNVPSEMTSLLSAAGNLRISGAVTSQGKRVVLKKLMLRDLNGIYRSLFLSRKSQHPNVLQCDGARVGQSQEVVELQFPFMPGGNLLQWARGRPRSMMTRLNALCGALEGLAHLHSLNICHRDLKPQNILMDSMEDVACPKLADFDQAKEVISGATTTLFSIGTLGYMAPEINQRAAPIDFKKSDVFAMAATAIVILGFNADESKLPYTQGAVRVFDFAGAYKDSVAKLQDVLDEESLLMLQRSLSRDPTKRPFAQELASALSSRKCYIQCCVKEQLTLTDGFVCSAFEPHFICKEDLDQHLARLEPASGALLKQGQEFFLKCPHGQNCGGTISIETISNRLSPASLLQILRLVETQTEVELRMELNMEHKAELDRIKQQTVNSIRVSTCDEYITDRIMQSRCPNCSVAYEHYDGCMAMICTKCQTKFCAACEDRCEGDPHEHVQSCPLVINQGDVFASREELERIHCTRRRNKLREYLKNQHLTTMQLQALEEKPNIKGAMRHLGLTKLSLLLD